MTLETYTLEDNVAIKIMLLTWRFGFLFFPMRRWFVFMERRGRYTPRICFLTSKVIVIVVTCELKPVTNSASRGVGGETVITVV